MSLSANNGSPSPTGLHPRVKPEGRLRRDRRWHTDGKQPIALIYDDSADNIGKTGLNWLFFAYSEIIGSFLPVSTAIAGFGDVDFCQ
jgi:hypothetical protein